MPDDHPIMERLEKLEWQFDFLLRYLNEKDILPDTAILSMNEWVKARTKMEKKGIPDFEGSSEVVTQHGPIVDQCPDCKKTLTWYEKQVGYCFTCYPHDPPDNHPIKERLGQQCPDCNLQIEGRGKKWCPRCKEGYLFDIVFEHPAGPIKRQKPGPNDNSEFWGRDTGPLIDTMIVATTVPEDRPIVNQAQYVTRYTVCPINATFLCSNCGVLSNLGEITSNCRVCNSEMINIDEIRNYYRIGDHE